MDNKEFKKLFNEVAKNMASNQHLAGGLKSQMNVLLHFICKNQITENYYELNIKIFIQGIFGERYKKSKELKNAVSDILGRQPEEYRDAFDLELSIDDETRRKKTERLFNDFLVHFVNTMLTREGIKKYALADKDFLPPAVNKELGL